jgi:hypothetical protein
LKIYEDLAERLSHKKWDLIEQLLDLLLIDRNLKSSHRAKVAIALLLWLLV